jgi:chaperonin cofactor prefoldin
MHLNMERADQDRINRYSYLIQRRNLTSSRRACSERERQNHQDALQELEEAEMVQDDADGRRFAVRPGTAFLHVPLEQACLYTQKQLDSQSAQAESSTKELEQIEKEMDVLRKVLTQKFGDGIRLE